MIENDVGQTAVPEVIVATEGEFRDPLVKAVAKFLINAKKQLNSPSHRTWPPPANYLRIQKSPGGLVDPEFDHLRIVVSDALRQRALYLADAFICAVRTLGFKVHLVDRRVLIEVQDISLRFRLYEAEEKQGREWDSPWLAKGLLRLSLRRNGYASGIPEGMLLRDEGKKRLEGQLAFLLAKLQLLARGAGQREEERNAEARRRAEEERKWEEEQQERERRAQIQREEAGKIDEFFAEADQWQLCQSRREYIDEIERMACEQDVALTEKSPARQWIRWARRACDVSDPTVKRVLQFSKVTE